MVHLFIYLLLSANWKDGKWLGKTVKRGQLITGRKKLSCVTGISEQSIRTCLRRLKKSGEIELKTTRNYMVVTVCNYDKYQNKEQKNNQPTNQRSTNDQPTINQQSTTIEEGKKERREEEKKDIPSFSEEIVLLVNDFVKVVESNFPKTSPKQTPRTVETYCDTIDKLMRIDGFSLEEIKLALNFGLNDSFWKSNILSLASLRKKNNSNKLTKFQNLFNAMGQAGKPAGKKSARQSQLAESTQEIKQFFSEVGQEEKVWKLAN